MWWRDRRSSSLSKVRARAATHRAWLLCCWLPQSFDSLLNFSAALVWIPHVITALSHSHPNSSHTQCLCLYHTRPQGNVYLTLSQATPSAHACIIRDPRAMCISPYLKPHPVPMLVSHRIPGQCVSHPISSHTQCPCLYHTGSQGNVYLTLSQATPSAHACITQDPRAMCISPYLKPHLVPMLVTQDPRAMCISP